MQALVSTDQPLIGLAYHACGSRQGPVNITRSRWIKPSTGRLIQRRNLALATFRTRVPRNETTEEKYEPVYSPSLSDFYILVLGKARSTRQRKLNPYLYFLSRRPEDSRPSHDRPLHVLHIADVAIPMLLPCQS